MRVGAWRIGEGCGSAVQGAEDKASDEAGKSKGARKSKRKLKGNNQNNPNNATILTKVLSLAYRADMAKSIFSHVKNI